MQLYDGINFLKKLNGKRLTNALQILSGFYWSKLLGKPKLSGLPISIAIEPTTSCNLRCPECPSGLRSFTRPTGMLQQQVFRKVIDELSEKLLYLTFYFQGEPYLHPGFLDMVRYATEKKIYTATSTNAHYLNDELARKTVESGLDRLVISIDGTTQETYQSYRIGGNLEKVIAGTKNVVKWKKKLNSKKPHLIFQFLVVRPNQHQIADLKGLAKDLGVDEVKLKTAQIYNYKQGSPLMPTLSQYARYHLQTEGTYTIKNSLENHCWKMWHSCVITWDGKVLPCCFDKDGAYTLGNLQEQRFEEIWKSEPYQQFRVSLLQSRSEIEICKNCTEGTKVWA